METIRFPLLSVHELTGTFRFRDLLQVRPPATDDPKHIHGGVPHGLTLEVLIDERTAPDRRPDEDVWGHDVRERERYDKLTRKPGVTDDPGWLAAERSIQGRLRGRAIAREVCNLLAVVTRHSFRDPPSEHAWAIDHVGQGNAPRHMQLWYPTLRGGPSDRLTDCDGPRVPELSTDEYWSRVGPGVGDTIDVPDDAEIRIESYFELSPSLRVAFARACDLARASRESWRTSRSLSFAAAVFSIEALIAASFEEPTKCEECGQATTDSRCGACGASRFLLTQRFRDFVANYGNGSGNQGDFEKRIYGIRGSLAHSGRLLRDDEFDSGFSAGGNDSEQGFGEIGFTLIPMILRNWLTDPPSSASLAQVNATP